MVVKSWRAKSWGQTNPNEDVCPRKDVKEIGEVFCMRKQRGIIHHRAQSSERKMMVAKGRREAKPQSNGMAAKNAKRRKRGNGAAETALSAW